MNVYDTGIKLFDKFPVRFPKNDSLVAILGKNGSGKTKLLEALKEYYEAHNEHVLYFPSDRVFEHDPDYIWASKITSDLIEEKDLSHYINRRYDLQLHEWDLKGRQGTYIDNGMLQLYNFYYSIDRLKKPSVILIDNIERNLHASVRKIIAEDLYKLPKVKKIIFTTYTYEVTNRYGNEVEIYDIDKWVNIKGV